MKKVYILLAASYLLFNTTSCKKFVEGEDTSPNSPANASLPLVLANSEVATFATIGGNMSRIASMWSQQSSGVQFQASDIDQYALYEGDIQNEWQTIYATGLKNLKIIRAKAGTANPYYAGIASVLEAVNIGIATDFWGDVPYSDALKGAQQIYTASYDKQEDVLAAMQTLLDNAIADLKKDASANQLLPGADDYIYQGDPMKWIGMAYVLKARYYMRTSKRDAGWDVKALKALDSAYANGFTSSASDANCVFGTNANEYNQWYAFCKVERRDYIKAGKTLVDIMNGISDPRLPEYFTLNDSGKYVGAALGSNNLTNVSEIGDYFASANSPTPIVTFVEAKFIEAEARFASDKAGSAKAYNDAVKAHVLLITGAAAPAPYVTAEASENAGSITMTKIMTQKYISGYTSLEPYHDWRRTGIPALVKNPLSNLSGIARRIPSSLEERLYNNKATIIQDHMVKVWWDN